MREELPINGVRILCVWDDESAYYQWVLEKVKRLYICDGRYTDSWIEIQTTLAKSKADRWAKHYGITTPEEPAI